MRKFCCVVGCLALAGFAATSYAEVIKYVDDRGTISFVDDVGKVPAKYRKRIIREEEQDAVQVIDGSSPQRGGAGGGGMVYICYKKTIEKGEFDRYDLTDFLAARGYNYRTLDISRNPENLKQCVDLYCKIYIKGMNDQGYKDYTIPTCISSMTGFMSTGEPLPMTFVGDKYYQGSSLDLTKTIDKHFNVNPATKWEK